MAVLVVLVLSFFFIGPRLESSLFPVVGNVKATWTEVDGASGIMKVSISAVARRECRLEDISVKVRHHDHWHKGAVFYEDPRGSNDETHIFSTDTPGNQAQLGVFSSSFFIFPVGPEVELALTHRCHPVWLSKTAIARLKVDR